jgi:hypothetical protein
VLSDIDHERGEQEITQDGKENDEWRDEIEQPAALQDGCPLPLRQRALVLPVEPDSDPDNEKERQHLRCKKIHSDQDFHRTVIPVRKSHVAEQPAQQQKAEYCDTRGQRAVLSQKALLSRLKVDTRVQLREAFGGDARCLNSNVPDEPGRIQD